MAKGHDASTHSGNTIGSEVMSAGGHERVEGCEDGRRVLQEREVAGIRDQLETSIRNRRSEGATVVGVDDAVRGAPDHEGRGVDSAQATEQSRVVHVRVAGERCESRRVALRDRETLGVGGGSRRFAGSWKLNCASSCGVIPLMSRIG